MNTNHSMNGGYSEYPFPNQNIYSDAMYQVADASQYQQSPSHYQAANGYSAEAYYDGAAQQAWDQGYANPTQYTPLQHLPADQDSPTSTISSPISPTKKFVQDDDAASTPKKRGRKKKVITESEKAVKREHFLERNRVAAGKCRQGKKVQIQSLVESEKKLRDTNMVLRMEVQALRAARDADLERFRMHMQNCHEGVPFPYEAPSSHSPLGPVLEATHLSEQDLITSSPESTSTFSPCSPGGTGMSRSQSDQSTQMTEFSPPELHAELKGRFDGMIAGNLDQMDDMEMGDFFDFQCPTPLS